MTWREKGPRGSRYSYSEDPDKPIRITGLGLARRPRKSHGCHNATVEDPDLCLFLRSRSETSVTSSKRFPGHRALGADPASLGNTAERRQEHRTAARAEKGKFGKLEC